MFRFLKLGLVVVLAVFLAACGTSPEKKTVEEQPPMAPPQTTTQAPPPAKQEEMQPKVNPLRDPNNLLSQRLVFFAFDSYTIEPQFRELVEAHAKYLTSHPSATITLRGHTDERGTHEYNIALGQRRADAVKRMMTLLGATDAQIETVSFGKELPRNPGHDEAAWAENRRVEIVYVTE